MVWALLVRGLKLKPVFSEALVLKFNEGKNAPVADIFSISVAARSNSLCFTDILLSKAYCTHSERVHFFTWALAEVDMVKTKNKIPNFFIR